MAKIGLFVEGGGMKCAYSAGVLDAFLDDKITFDYAIGVSAGSANAASYLAGQRDRAKRFYTEHINEPGYLSVGNFFKTGNMFGLQYIYGTLSNSDGADFLDYPAMMANPTEFVVVATNARTGEPVYFNKKDFVQDDYREIMASSAIPAACKPIEIDGEYYYDGGISDAIPVQRMLDDGCDKIVAVLSKTRDFVKTPEKMKAFYTLMCRKYPKTIDLLNHRHEMYTKKQRHMYELEKQGKAFIFAPSNPPQMGTFSKDPAIEQQLYDLGLSDYQELRESFLAFLQ